VDQEFKISAAYNILAIPSKAWPGILIICFNCFPRDAYKRDGYDVRIQYHNLGLSIENSGY
jgi:hypothetical protein